MNQQDLNGKVMMVLMQNIDKTGNDFVSHSLVTLANCIGGIIKISAEEEEHEALIESITNLLRRGLLHAKT